MRAQREVDLGTVYSANRRNNRSVRQFEERERDQEEDVRLRKEKIHPSND